MARILIVDDHSIARRVLTCQLEREGHVIIQCDNGAAALEAARREFPDLVITDLCMPGMDGIQLVAELRKLAPTQRTPIFFHTASGDDRKIQEVASAYGVSRILSKPCPAKEMLAAIAAVLGGETVSAFGAIPENLKARIPEYLDSCDCDIATIKSALAASDLATIQEVGHNLKGTGCAYGFDRLTEIGNHLELAAKTGDRTEIAGQLRNLASYLAGIHPRPEAAVGIENPIEDQTPTREVNS